ncbi:DUF6286 domain-containing protein [Actinomadura sp. HBU206391]|uniref:DUF6286 domain-containing protein n=1 Tax=Actinomadura sp. HBU206391 TaxID=2731692 RepID=UPI00164FDDC2|nr:DUF6286 domain-containing protein [Actinomadura sp. HBU206391]MBC6457367.1 hypothetical protein [Actinomadura sp. HBU206391]
MRAFNRIAALVLSLALIVGGLFIAVQAVLAAFHRAPWPLPLRSWHDDLVGTRLDDPVTTIVAAALGVIGLVLLIAELRPWRPSRLPVHPATADPSSAWWVVRGPAERRLAAATARIPGVNKARVRLRGRHRWKVNVRAEARDESRRRIAEAIEDELDRLAAPAHVRVRLRLRKPRRVT